MAILLDFDHVFVTTNRPYSSFTETRNAPLAQSWPDLHFVDATPLGLKEKYGVGPRVASAAALRRNPGLWD